MEEWRKMHKAEAEKKRAEREAAAEEKRVEHEVKERKAAIELERLKQELEAKRLETAALPTGITEEVVWRSAGIA